MFETYAQKLGLDIEKFKSDFNSAKAKTKIEADIAGGTKEISGTPTFFLNNQKIKTPKSYAEFRGIIEQAITTP